MGYYDENVREVYAKKTYEKAIVAIFDLNKFEPFALPFYACLHAMVQNKRRVFDTKNLKIRMADGKTYCWARIEGMAKNYEYRRYNVNGRRDRIEPTHGVRVGSHPLEFEELMGCVKEAYNKPAEPEAIEYAKRFDAFIAGLTKMKYKPLDNVFEDEIKSAEAPIKTRIEKLKLRAVEEISVGVSGSSIETTLYVVDRVTNTKGEKIEFFNGHDVNVAEKNLVFNRTTVEVDGDSGKGELLQIAAESAAPILEITRDETKKGFERTMKKFNETEKMLSGLDDKVDKFAKEATMLYEKYYKSSIEELRDARNVGKITI